MALHAAVFLITLSGLIFEIGLTRIYSATIRYHFAFIAVSVALLGWGLGGVAVHLLRRRITPTLDLAAGLTLLYAGAFGFQAAMFARQHLLYPRRCVIPGDAPVIMDVHLIRYGNEERHRLAAPGGILFRRPCPGQLAPV